jgi:hypothetical protein
MDGLIMRSQDRFFRQMMHTVLPLLVWAAHFFFCYVYAAEACQRTVLVVVSLVAALAAAALLAQAVLRITRTDGKPRLLHRASMAIALLSLIGILWSSIPIVMLKC